MNAGEILIRQKGSWYRSGPNTYVAKDWTIHAEIAGTVSFRKCKREKFNGRRELCTIVSILPSASPVITKKTAVAAKKAKTGAAK